MAEVYYVEATNPTVGLGDADTAAGIAARIDDYDSGDRDSIFDVTRDGDGRTVRIHRDGERRAFTVYSPGEPMPHTLPYPSAEDAAREAVRILAPRS